MFFHETEHLGTDDDGILFHLAGDDRVRLGRVGDAENRAFDLGLEGEYEEHLDRWRDSQSCDYAGQVLSDYRSQQGY